MNGVKLSRELKRFYDRLFSEGLYILACGGGAICEPVKARDALRPKYGDCRLRELCMELLLDTSRP